jgi:hypothetical protein
MGYVPLAGLGVWVFGTDLAMPGVCAMGGAPGTLSVGVVVVIDKAHARSHMQWSQLLLSLKRQQ